MNTRFVSVAAALAFCLWPALAFAATSSGHPPAAAEIKLRYGITPVKLGPLSFQIVKGLVGTGTASDFDTYTIYLAPARAGEPWMHVTTPAGKGLGYNFRAYESGDANTQAVAFYVVDNVLHAVQASKIGPAADKTGSRKTPFAFEVFVFNDSEDIPMFDSAHKRRSAGQYVDATEALQREFFSR